MRGLLDLGAVLSRSFLTVFVGTAIVSIALALSALPGWRGSGAGLRLAGALLYLLGTIAVTRVCHIPRNDALAAVALVWSTRLARA